MKTHPVKKIDNDVLLGKYINPDTGEYMLSELGGKNVVVSEDTGLKVIDRKDYAVIGTEAVMVLSRILSNTDLANILKMAVVTKTSANIIFNNNVPHTNETLQKYLEIRSEAMYMNLIKRLIKAGILYQLKGRVWGEVRVVYLLNPYLSSKRKTLDSKVFEIFEKFNIDCVECHKTESVPDQSK